MIVKVWFLLLLCAAWAILTRTTLIMDAGFCVPHEPMTQWNCPPQYQEMRRMEIVGRTHNHTVDFQGQECCKEEHHNHHSQRQYVCVSKVANVFEVDTIGWLPSWLCMSFLLSFPLAVYILDKYVIEPGQIIYGDDLKIGFYLIGLMFWITVTLGLLSEFLLVRPLYC